MIGRDAVPGNPAGMSLYEHIGETSLVVGGDHERDECAGGIVQVVVDELADVSTGAAAEYDNAGSKCKQEAIGEWDCAAEILPCVRGGTGDNG